MYIKKHQQNNSRHLPVVSISIGISVVTSVSTITVTVTVSVVTVVSLSIGFSISRPLAKSLGRSGLERGSKSGVASNTRIVEGTVVGVVSVAVVGISISLGVRGSEGSHDSDTQNSEFVHVDFL